MAAGVLPRRGRGHDGFIRFQRGRVGSLAPRAASATAVGPPLVDRTPQGPTATPVLHPSNVRRHPEAVRKASRLASGPPACDSTSGPARASSIRAARPDLRVLFMSGYPRDSIGNAGSMDDRTAFIRKPFAGDALVRKVREVLDAPTDSSSATPGQGAGGRILSPKRRHRSNPWPRPPRHASRQRTPRRARGCDPERDARSNASRYSSRNRVAMTSS
jgi:hypothetical protein